MYLLMYHYYKADYPEPIALYTTQEAAKVAAKELLILELDFGEEEAEKEEAEQEWTPIDWNIKNRGGIFKQQLSRRSN